MAIYLYLNERDIIKEVVAVPHRVISPQYIEYHEQDLTLIGKLWDRATATAVANPYPEPVIITRYAFRGLFTMTEKIALYKGAGTDTVLQIFIDDIMAAEKVELTMPDMHRGIGYLVSQGVLTEERAAQVLNNEKVEE